MRLPLPTQSARGRSLPLSAERLVNLYAEAAPTEAKSPVVLHGAPGLTTFATAGSGPIRGLAVMAGTLYAVSGSGVYKIASSGTTTLLGTVTGSGAVSLATNGTGLAIVSGTSGYLCNGATVTPITDPDFPGASSVDYLDGYFVFSRADTGQFFISALLDGANYDALDFATAESSPDDLLRVIVDHREVWLFGESTIEVWFNSGAAGFPFERLSGAVIERGIAAGHAAAKVDNSIYWLGEDLIVYRAQGYTPQRVSTHAVEQAIAGYSTVSDALALAYTQEGHKFVVLTFTSAGATWVYDISTGLWHERQSFGLGRWRANGYANAYGRHLVGDYANGKVYTLDLDTYDEDGETMQGILQFPPIHSDRARLILHSFELDIEAGVGLTTGQGSDPQLMLEWSDDGARTWRGERWVSLGRLGEYSRRAIWRRLGQFRQRTLRVTITDPVKRAIIAAHAHIEAGRG